MVPRGGGKEQIRAEQERRDTRETSRGAAATMEAGRRAAPVEESRPWRRDLARGGPDPSRGAAAAMEANRRGGGAVQRREAERDGGAGEKEVARGGRKAARGEVGLAVEPPPPWRLTGGEEAPSRGSSPASLPPAGSGRGAAAGARGSRVGEGGGQERVDGEKDEAGGEEVHRIRTGAEDEARRPDGQGAGCRSRRLGGGGVGGQTRSEGAGSGEAERRKEWWAVRGPGDKVSLLLATPHQWKPTLDTESSLIGHYYAG
ncbi:hypothetical protein U9M48_006093 [Paspalum notatum var. saurae]|uniref:Uncharacterized protein n=1 Tax=Paspalum notatum var. saurae TaxID=547442 RepID=A0AAQ3SFX6_PASNO